MLLRHRVLEKLRPSGSPPREELVARLVPGKSFLDVGCMWSVDGAISFAAAAAGARAVTGFDVMAPSELFLERQRAAPLVEYVNGDVHDPPPTLAPHDVVWCSGVLYHAPHPLLTLEKLKALTKPGGTLILATEVVPGRGTRCDFAPKPGVHPTHTVPFDPAIGYGNWYWAFTPGAVDAMCEATGFTIKETHGTRWHRTVVVES